MLDKPVDGLVFEGGKVVGVRSGNEVARCKQVSFELLNGVVITNLESVVQVVGLL